MWTLIRSANEPSERVTSRQITRLHRRDPRSPSALETGELDEAQDRLPGADQDLKVGVRRQGFNGVINGTDRIEDFEDGAGDLRP